MHSFDTTHMDLKDFTCILPCRDGTNGSSKCSYCGGACISNNILKKYEKNYLKVKFEDNSTFLIPIILIAYNRALYYTNNDSTPDNWNEYISIFNTEFEFTADYNDQLIDWVLNNMDWKDLENDAIQIRKPSYHSMWTQSKFTTNVETGHEPILEVSYE